MKDIPIVRYGEPEFNQKIVTAFKEIGFVAINLQTISYPENLNTLVCVHNAYNSAKSFFAMPEEYKNTHVRQGLFGQRGYTQFGKEKAKDQNIPDLKEFLQLGSSDNLAPDSISQIHYDCLLDMFAEMDLLAKVVLNSVFHEMKIESGDIGSIVERQSILRAIHYPPTGENPNGIRSAAHEDINFITLLPAASAAGLQVLNKDGDWIDAPTDRNLIIVNVGDMLQEFTNGELKSTTHRVINTEEGKTQSRYSIPFFFHPKSDFRLSARYTAGEYLDQRLKEIGLKK